MYNSSMFENICIDRQTNRQTDRQTGMQAFTIAHTAFRHTIILCFLGYPIVFDPDGVWPLPHNPSLSDYPVGSQARFLAEDFVRLYWKLMYELQLTFSGQPEKIDGTVSAMFLLRLKAQELVKVQVNKGDPSLHAGPLFENPLRFKVNNS